MPRSDDGRAKKREKEFLFISFEKEFPSPPLPPPPLPFVVRCRSYAVLSFICFPRLLSFLCCSSFLCCPGLLSFICCFHGGEAAGDGRCGLLLAAG